MPAGGYDIGLSTAISSSAASSMGGAPFNFQAGGGSGIGPFSTGARNTTMPIWPIAVVAAAAVLIVLFIFTGRRKH